MGILFGTIGGLNNNRQNMRLRNAVLNSVNVWTHIKYGGTHVSAIDFVSASRKPCLKMGYYTGKEYVPLRVAHMRIHFKGITLRNR